jgi:type IV pilus assembly protein PilC
VEKRIPLSTPLKKDPNFDQILAQMVMVGEETGKVDEVLERLAGFFESEAAQKVANISSAIEPIIIVFLGIIIGLFVVSIITPIYNLTSYL